MKKLTPKQRAKIYLEAAEYFTNLNRKPFDKIPVGYGFCAFLKKQFSKYDINSFPEYKNFKSKSRKLPWGFYFPIQNKDESEQSERITALLFSYQMALDAKE